MTSDRDYWKGFRCRFLACALAWFSASIAWADEVVKIEAGEYAIIPVPKAIRTAEFTSEFKLRPSGPLCIPYQEWGTGRCIVAFSTRKPGTYYLFVTYPTGGEVFDIVVGGEDPDDDDDDPTPPPLTGLAKQVYDVAHKINEPLTARAIANNYQRMTDSITGGAYNVGDFLQMQPQIIKWLYDQNHPMVEKNPLWSTLFDMLEKSYKQAHKDGKLKTVQDMAANYVEVEKGLRRAAQ